ncbi:hypothetical protein ABIB99_007534 [Bradyrhizobium sp. LA6.1]
MRDAHSEPSPNHSLWVWVPDRRSASLRLSGTTTEFVVAAPPHTIRNTTAPNAPAHSAIAAMPWIAKPGPRFAAAFE